MTYSLAAASTNPAGYLTTYNVTTSHPKNETSSQAINIGNLDQSGATVSAADNGSNPGAPVSTSFTTTGGDTISLSSNFGNYVDQLTTDFQLYDSSGNIVADSQGTSQQQAAYTEWVAGNLQLAADTYTATATPELSSTPLNISSSTQQGTTLAVNSQLTGGDTSEYYNFSLSGTNLKLGFDAGSGQSSTRVQLYNSSGNLVADSAGNAYQKANYIALTSGPGLNAAAGSYSVQVSYAPGADTTQNINYNFQLYSGSNYAVAYDTNVKAQPADYSAAGSVTATSNAQEYSRQGFNQINTKPASAINIGWLAENKSTLNVNSQLTGSDSTDYYSFTLQTGNNLKFGFNKSGTTNSTDLRVQILDSSGSEIIADSNGTAAQQAAYKSLTTTDGLAAKSGGYIVKISYPPGAAKTTNSYNFNLYSGTSYSAQYTTIASAQTYGNAILTGTLPGTVSAGGYAAYLTNIKNGTDVSIISAIAATA